MNRSLVSLLLAGAAVAASPQDAERATHTDTASTPQVSYETNRDGVVVRQYQLGCLSHLSYLVVAGGEAAVIDPQRDVGHYLLDAEKMGAKIRFVLLTHPHADFVAGHLELAAQTGAQVVLSKLAGAAFPHRALEDGESVAIGGATLMHWATPGHTPDASTFLLAMPGQAEPSFAFTGDTLFVGSIGRPDLLDKPPAELASQSFDSIQRLKSLPDAVVVLPAHGAGSLCGAHLSPETTSTIGAEKATNAFLCMKSRSTFVSNVLSHQPVAPQYFAMNVAMNRKGPPIVARAAELPQALDVAQVRAALEKGGWVVDVRDQQTYAKGHISGSINIALRGRLDTWMGIVVPVDAPLVLISDNEDGVREGAFRLRRIGYDTLAGYLSGGIAAWQQGGGEVRASKLVTPRELHDAMEKGTEPLVIDVRSADEYGDLRLGEIGNIPVTESDRFRRMLDMSQPVLMVCNSAYRSSMAVGLAERLGFKDVGSLDGGLDAWIEAGFAVIGNKAADVDHVAHAIVTPQSGAISLPEPVDSALLARVLATQPDAYAVIDVRPAAQFAEWSIPGSTNVALAQLAAHVRALPATARVVLVDRDGTTSFAAAGGLLAQDPNRAIRALLGGLQAFYAATQFGGQHGASHEQPAAQVVPASPANEPQAPAAQKKAKKRSAGC
jgi:rhodanese-related sulfurtransferase/glyoxylase-like metal-dependent hydrolase (beta-lactamase superfamily II)